jgi:hypothetical protein
MVSMVRDTSFVPAVRAAISSLMTPAGPPYCDRRLSSERVVMACRATAIFAAAPALSEPSKRRASSLAMKSPHDGARVFVSATSIAAGSLPCAFAACSIAARASRNGIACSSIANAAW